MTITSTGYGGSVFEASAAGWSTALGTEYGVEREVDWLVTAVTGADRTVSIAPGAGWGRGVRDVSDAPVALSFDPVTSGMRWDLVVMHRDWSGLGGVSTFRVIKGVPGNDGAPAMLARARMSAATPTVDDQPISFVRIDAGVSQPGKIADVRVWQANGGCFSASDQWPQQYLTRPGTTFRTPTNTWYLDVSSAGLAVWSSEPRAPGAWGILAMGAGWGAWGCYPQRRTWAGRVWYKGTATSGGGLPDAWVPFAGWVTSPPGYPSMTLHLPIGSNASTAAHMTIDSSSMLHVRAPGATFICLDGASHDAA